MSKTRYLHVVVAEFRIELTDEECVNAQEIEKLIQELACKLDVTSYKVTHKEPVELDVIPVRLSELKIDHKLQQEIIETCKYQKLTRTEMENRFDLPECIVSWILKRSGVRSNKRVTPKYAKLWQDYAYMNIHQCALARDVKPAHACMAALRQGIVLRKEDKERFAFKRPATGGVFVMLEIDEEKTTDTPGSDHKGSRSLRNRKSYYRTPGSEGDRPAYQQSQYYSAQGGLDWSAQDGPERSSDLHQPGDPEGGGSDPAR